MPHSQELLLGPLVSVTQHMTSLKTEAKISTVAKTEKLRKTSGKSMLLIAFGKLAKNDHVITEEDKRFEDF